jgi:uncharacterized protein YjiS (DUF1127 family)
MSVLEELCLFRPCEWNSMRDTRWLLDGLEDALHDEGLSRKDLQCHIMTKKSLLSDSLAGPYVYILRLD